MTCEDMRSCGCKACSDLTGATRIRSRSASADSDTRGWSGAASSKNNKLGNSKISSFKAPLRSHSSRERNLADTSGLPGTRAVPGSSHAFDAESASGAASTTYEQDMSQSALRSSARGTEDASGKAASQARSTARADSYGGTLPSSEVAVESREPDAPAPRLTTKRASPSDWGPPVSKPEYNPNASEKHGGVVYLSETDWHGQIPSHRIITVGYYKSGDPRKNALDKETIKEALLELTDFLRYKDGVAARTKEYDGIAYQPSSREIIVIKGGGGEREGGAYDGGFSLGHWVQLVPDGKVIIRAPISEGPVISIAKAPAGRPIDPTCNTCLEDAAHVPTILIGDAGAWLGQTPDGWSPGTFQFLPLGYPVDPVDPVDPEDLDDLIQFGSRQRAIESHLNQKLDIRDATFSNFKVYGSGAAISNFSGTATRCHFEKCEVSVNPDQAATDKTASGGAILGSTAGRPELSSCTFNECAATGNGGAVEQGGRISGCTFTGCSANGDGGAISEASIVTNVTCTNCSAGGSGGAMSDVDKWIGFELVDDSTTKGKKKLIGSCTITACTALQGGAIANCTAEIASCFIDRNRATGAGGGGLYNVTGDIDRCSITRNSAVLPPSPPAAKAKKKKPTDHNGGGLLLCSGSITNCIIVRNRAGNDGGGLFDCDGALLNLDILQNRADELGGGAANCARKKRKIQNCIILGNWCLKDAINAKWPDLSADDKWKRLSKLSANSNQLSKCSSPAYCFLPHAWRGDHHARNVFDDEAGSGPGFVIPPARPASPDDDPTTLPDFVILNLTQAEQRLYLTKNSAARGEGKSAGVAADFDGTTRPAGSDAPSIGAFDNPPPSS
jgi:hypothetical protein